MSRLFVMNDNLTTRIEIGDPSGDGEHYAACVGCGVDLVQGDRERFNLEDTLEVAGIHADRCKRCADPECRNPVRHDAGHRCRKPSNSEMFWPDPDARPTY
jgi:hypothetical protein